MHDHNKLDPRKAKDVTTIILCNVVYPYLLKVRHLTKMDQITANDTDIRTSLMVKEAAPNVDDWQYAGDIGKFFLFRFKTQKLRWHVNQYLNCLGYRTEFTDYRSGYEFESKPI